ncbi:MAG TPA: thioredoxin domain-containing protein, partial [Chitinophagaceae bacterium]|nr:thioredoxin domain-containing protein [Chitinophagaceae bacterium]
MPNRLINETSPYLLQHAQNPVDWYPWGNEALEKAKKENKPILVSIGYSACHWCHVMEKESFENEETAALMNEHFVNIKIDREERPDLDHIYMDAVQAMTGSGGWPLNVFLTPSGKPFYGGTYFPPQRAFNRSSWRETLLAVSGSFQQKREEIDLQSETLTEHLVKSNSFGLQKIDDISSIFSEGKVDETFQNLLHAADKEWGGFGNAPKFPQTFSIQFSLRYYYVKKDETALKQACLSLDKMIEGGIYDQLGGGFARYSTDEEWLVPHFEKMLYDNALILSTLSEAYQFTKTGRYKEVIAETFGFIQRELMHPGGAFYSALDADSEGEEGKYYVWQYEEIDQLLGKDSDIFCDFFGVKRNGNWEGENILHTKKSLELFAREKNIPVDELKNTFQKNKQALLAERNKKIRPALDDKIILSWNALINTACSKAFAATGNETYRQLAIENMNFLLLHFKQGDREYYNHSWKNNKAKDFAFLDDYAFLIEALLHLQEITGDIEWLLTARKIAEYVIRNFSEADTGFFFFTDMKQGDVILRKKEVYDGATPSGNATMAYNIYQLSILFDIPGWRKRSEKMVASLSNPIIRYPTSFGIWACLFMEMIYGTDEIAVVGKDPYLLAGQVLAEYIPHKVFMKSTMSNENLPLLIGKLPKDISLIYLCRAYSCLKPVSGVI